MARHFTPLRYPGGKAALANFVKALLLRNDLLGCEYAEPYCGGAGVAMELLRLELVSSIRINDADPAIACFWRTVVSDPDELCRRVARVKLTVAQWRKQRSILRNPTEHSQVDLGFAAFYLNRVNRSGILSAGPIGGMAQNGNWLIDARFNRNALIETLQEIGQFHNRIHVHNEDALAFLARIRRRPPGSTFCYLDPPYVVQGKRLYQNFYTESDHAKVARAVAKLECPWIVSYDNVPLIRQLYGAYRSMTYGIGYSAHQHTVGSEIMLFADRVDAPSVGSPLKISNRDWRSVAIAA